MKNNTIKFSTTEEDVGYRLDVVLAKRITDLTRSNLKKIIESKNVTVDNSVVSSPSKKINLNELINVNFTIENTNEIKPSNIKLNIVYEDKDLLVVNKPSEMVLL